MYSSGLQLRCSSTAVDKEPHFFGFVDVLSIPSFVKV